MTNPQSTAMNQPDYWLRAGKYLQTPLIPDKDELKNHDVNAPDNGNLPEITDIFIKIVDSYLRNTILISGSADVYGDFQEKRAVEFLHDLSKGLSINSNKILSGFGWGVGSAIINGVLDNMANENPQYLDSYIIMRPFPQFDTKGKNISGLWTDYRKKFIALAGIGIFVFGNRKNKTTGQIEPATGMMEEFELAVSMGLKVIPIGATGFVARELWQKVMDNFDRFYPDDLDLNNEFIKLGEIRLPNETLIQSILYIINRLHSK